MLCSLLEVSFGEVVQVGVELEIVMVTRLRVHSGEHGGFNTPSIVHGMIRVLHSDERIQWCTELVFYLHPVVPRPEVGVHVLQQIFLCVLVRDCAEIERVIQQAHVPHMIAQSTHTRYYQHMM